MPKWVLVPKPDAVLTQVTTTPLMFGGERTVIEYVTEKGVRFARVEDTHNAVTWWQAVEEERQ